MPENRNVKGIIPMVKIALKTYSTFLIAPSWISRHKVSNPGKPIKLESFFLDKICCFCEK
jgi:hypothetical protein